MAKAVSSREITPNRVRPDEWSEDFWLALIRIVKKVDMEKRSSGLKGTKWENVANHLLSENYIHTGSTLILKKRFFNLSCEVRGRRKQSRSIGKNVSQRVLRNMQEYLESSGVVIVDQGRRSKHVPTNQDDDKKLFLTERATSLQFLQRSDREFDQLGEWVSEQLVPTCKKKSHDILREKSVSIYGSEHLMDERTSSLQNLVIGGAIRDAFRELRAQIMDQVKSTTCALSQTILQELMKK